MRAPTCACSGSTPRQATRSTSRTRSPRCALVERPHPPALDEVFGEIWRLTVERAYREALATWLRGLGRRYGLQGGELSKADAAMLEAEVLRARHVRTPEERAREVAASLATEIIRNVLRAEASTRPPSP